MIKARLVLEVAGAEESVFTSGAFDYLIGEKSVYVACDWSVCRILQWSGLCIQTDWKNKRLYDSRTKEFDYYFGVRNLSKKKAY